MKQGNDDEPSIAAAIADQGNDSTKRDLVDLEAMLAKCEMKQAAAAVANESSKPEKGRVDRPSAPLWEHQISNQGREI